MPYLDTATLGQDDDTLAQRYEHTMARLEQITKAVYEVNVMWECEFDRDILPKHPKLRNHPLVQHAPLNT
jgi:G:T-mismatch repair DNA endonuclease (very short patch repair protein)